MSVAHATLFAFACATGLAAVPAVAQVPDTFTNLTVIDEDSSRRELVSIMRSWAGDLGVRCSHCHVGPDNLVGMDFASDDKETKRTARRMLGMLRAINGPMLADLPIREAPAKAQVVTCYSCHRGQARPPRNILTVLREVEREQGVDAAVAEFQRLRTEHHSDGTYDLSVRTLRRLAQWIAERDRPDDAVRVLEVGLEIDSRSTDLLVGLAMVKLQLGALAEAKSAADKALALAPDDDIANSVAARIDAAIATAEE